MPIALRTSASVAVGDLAGLPGAAVQQLNRVGRLELCPAAPDRCQELIHRLDHQLLQGQPAAGADLLGQLGRLAVRCTGPPASAGSPPPAADPAGKLITRSLSVRAASTLAATASGSSDSAIELSRLFDIFRPSRPASRPDLAQQRRRQREHRPYRSLKRRAMLRVSSRCGS